eukprot:g4496.t1
MESNSDINSVSVKNPVGPFYHNVRKDSFSEETVYTGNFEIEVDEPENQQSSKKLSSPNLYVCILFILFFVFGLLFGRVIKRNLQSNDAYRDEANLERIIDWENSFTEWAALPSREKPLHRIVFGSCALQSRSQPFWDIFQRLEPDLTILTGDTVYGDCKTSNCTELMEAYSTLNAKPSFQGAKRSLPLVAIWDDHDSGLNDAGRLNPFKEIAKKLALSFYDVAKTDERRNRDGLFTSYTFGTQGFTTQIILLDTRWNKDAYECAHPQCKSDPSDKGNEKYKPSSSPSLQMLGEAQWKWLKEKLKEEAELRIIVTSIQFLASTGWESWRNMPLQQQKLLQTIADAREENGEGDGVILISGDRHVGGIYTLPKTSKDNPAGYSIWEVTSSALTHSLGSTGCPAFTDAIKADPFATGVSADANCDEEDELRIGSLVRVNNFGLIDIDWNKKEVRLELRRASDAAYVTKEDDDRSIISSYVVKMSDLNKD